MNSFKTREGAPVPTSAATVTEDGLIISAMAMEAKHELILQDGDIGMVLETVIKVEVDDGGRKVIKVKSSYKQLLPQPSAEQEQAQAQAQADEMRAAPAHFKVKLD